MTLSPDVLRLNPHLKPKMLKRAREESPLEVEFFEQVAQAGLPQPIRQFKFSRQGRKWKSDFAWIEQRIIVEVEGGTYQQGRHTRPKGFRGDCVKYNNAVREGWRLFRFTSDMIWDKTAIEFMQQVFDEIGTDVLKW